MRRHPRHYARAIIPLSLTYAFTLMLLCLGPRPYAIVLVYALAVIPSPLRYCA